MKRPGPQDPEGLRMAAARGAGGAAPRRAASVETIGERFVRSACERLGEGKPLRRSLPVWGRIHVDRQLPFLCVFRRRPEDEGAGTEDLLVGEASYLLASAEPRQHAGVASLVRGVVSTLLPYFGAFLLVELWASSEGRTVVGAAPPTPRFRIFRSRRSETATTADVLEAGLRKIVIHRRRAQVEVQAGARIAPPGLRPLVAGSSEREGVHVIGIEVPEIYRDAGNGQPLPLVRRALHRGLSRALKRAFFEFAHHATDHQPPHFHALGRRSMVRAVWQVDRGLAELSQAFDLLLAATPTNTDAAWQAFRRAGFAGTPRFSYRPLAVDPGLLKRTLWQIPVERIEDPTLEDLFRRQQIDLDRRLSMLSDRLTPSFVAGSLQVFGRPDPALRELARDVLEQVPPRTRDEDSSHSVDAAEFAARAEQELAYYRKQLPELTSRAEVRADYSGLVVSQGNLLVGASSRIPRRRVEALLSHEIGTHVVTYANGRAQPFRQLHVGLPDYEELQEGLAVLSEYLVGGLSRPRLRLLAARVVAVQNLLDGATFEEVFRELDVAHAFGRRTAFTITMRVFRGGGLTKDFVYLRGLDTVLDHLRRGGEIEPLLIGKLGAHHIGMIRELQWRGILREAPLRPRYMDDLDAQKRLADLREGRSVLDLIGEGDK